jgi:hypothetical protein
MVEATWQSPGGPVALRLVHPPAPFPAYWREWTAALAATAIAAGPGYGSDHRYLTATVAIQTLIARNLIGDREAVSVG